MRVSGSERKTPTVKNGAARRKNDDCQPVRPVSYDLGAIRDRFPALAASDEGKPRVFFDNPAGTQVPRTVAERMSAYLLESNANMGGAFTTSALSDAVIDNAHRAMADFLNAAVPEEIVFGQNMTTITLHVSRSIGRTLKAGDEIVLSRMDHDANVAPWLLLAEDLNLEVRWLPFNVETYEFDAEQIERAITERTKLVCVGAASNLLGTINDVASIAKHARSVGALTYIDAVQLAPHVAIDVQALGCDFLVCSAYKFFGPHQGILWGRRDLLESLTPYKVRPASDRPPFNFETGTQSHEGMAGTAAAIDYFAWIGKTFAGAYHERNAAYPPQRQLLRSAMQCLFDYERALTAELLDRLSALPGVTVHGITDRAALDRRVPTVAFTVDGVAPNKIAEALGRRNIFVWSGHNYAVEAAESLGLLERGGAVRVGPVHYNSRDELDSLSVALEQIIPAERAA